MTAPDPVERLGRLLLEKRILTPEQLDHCLRDRRTSVQQGKPRELSEIIVSRGYLDAERMTRALEAVKAPPPLRAVEKKETRRAPAPPPRLNRRLVVASGAATAGLLAAVVVTLVVFRKEPEPPPSPATPPVPPPATASPVVAPKPPEKGPPPLIAGDPEERRLQEALLEGIVAAIQRSPRDLPRLALRERALDRVRLLDATRETLFVRHAGRALEIPWEQVAPMQVAELGREARAGLGLVIFSLRHGLSLEAVRAADALAGTPSEPRAKELLVQAGLAKAEERPVVRPPEPPPTLVAPPPKPRPAPRDPFQEVLSRWSYRADWKAYGPEFARALADRGWEDLAFEITANLLISPGQTPEAKAEAFFAAAFYRGLAAARAEDLEDRLALFEAAIRAFRDLDVPASLPALALRAHEEEARLRQARGRELLRAGRRPAADQEFQAARQILTDRIEAFARFAVDPPEGPGDVLSLAAWRRSRDQVLLAKFDWALAALAQAEAMAEVPGTRDGLPDLLRRLMRFVEDNLAYAAGAELATIEASTILGRALRLQAVTAAREPAREHWQQCLAAAGAGAELLGTPAARAHPAVRGTIARSVLAEMKARASDAERSGLGAPSAFLRSVQRAEAFLAAFPEMRTLEMGHAIRLEAARSAFRAGQAERGDRFLEDVLRESPPGSWSEVAALDLAAELNLVRDPRRARILADRLFDRGGDDLVRALRLYRSIGDAHAQYRIGLAYAALGRPYESAAALAALQQGGDPILAGDAALLRFRSLRAIQELTGERKELDDLQAKGLANPNSPRLGELENEIGRLTAARPARPAPPEFRVEGPLAGITLPKPASAFGFRSQREALAAKGGGGKDTEAAVLAALRWLSRHQSGDGSWKAQGYISECRKIKRYAGGGNCTPNPGYEDFDAGLTGLALLAFLGAGWTPLSEEVHDGIFFGECVQRGLRWLVAQQDPEGCVGSRNCQKYMYNHGLGALALVEGYGLSRAPWLKGPAQKAVDFTIAAQNPGKGWRYAYKCGDNDSSVTGWQVMVLRAAEMAGLPFPRTAHDGARAWYDEVTEEAYGRAGYTHKGTGKVFVPGLNEQFDHHEALTAFAVHSRIVVDPNLGDPRLLAGCDLLNRDRPRWEGNLIDFYYWFLATNALFQLEGPTGPKWKGWNEDLKNALVKHQNTGAAGCKDGSWETIDRWSGEGGRVFATALNALTLETYYRYPPTFGAPKEKR